MKAALQRLRDRLSRLMPVKLHSIDIDWSLSDEDLANTLVRHESSPLLFGSVDTTRVMADLEELGIADRIRSRGYRDLYPDCASHVQFEDRFILWGHHPRAQEPQMLVDVRTHLGHLEGTCPHSNHHYSVRALVWDWISFQDPMADFKRAALPGQEHPGLGIFRESTNLMKRYVEEMEIDALVAVPEFFHNALLYSKSFLFFEAEVQGRFEAMVRDLMPRGLSHASRALDQEKVLSNGQPVGWRPSEMVVPLKPHTRSHFESPTYQKTRTEAKLDYRFEYTSDQPS